VKSAAKRGPKSPGKPGAKPRAKPGAKRSPTPGPKTTPASSGSPSLPSSPLSKGRSAPNVTPHLAPPKLIIFDVDGVLVDVRGSFHRSIIDTVRHFTGKRVTYADIQQWKRRTGYNDDWRLTTDWVASLGGNAKYAQVKRAFQKIYWGVDGKRGNVWRERWLVPRHRLERWAKHADLALFTGRTRRELRHTLERFGMSDLFGQIVTMNDVENLKPHPEGLLRLLGGADPHTAIYLGDVLDDALAARSAGIPFYGVLARGSDAHRVRAAQLREHGSRAILHSTNELEKYWR
jgi:HAD superfamily hydrolase (TIGR01548 family)